jgi:hypothetical protein
MQFYLNFSGKYILSLDNLYYEHAIQSQGDYRALPIITLAQLPAPRLSAPGNIHHATRR